MVWERCIPHVCESVYSLGRVNVANKTLSCDYLSTPLKWSTEQVSPYTNGYCQSFKDSLLGEYSHLSDHRIQKVCTHTHTHTTSAHTRLIPIPAQRKLETCGKSLSCIPGHVQHCPGECGFNFCMYALCSYCTTLNRQSNTQGSTSEA